MGEIHALVQYGDDDRRIAGAEFPGFFGIDVGPGDELGRSEVTAVDKIPLERKQLIIEYSAASLGQGKRPEWDGFA